MNIRMTGIAVGVSALLILGGCQGTNETAETPEDQAPVQEQSGVEESARPYAEGFDSSKEALNAYMQALVEKDFDMAYEALHEIDKSTFSQADFAEYQKAVQLAKDLHGYSIHDEQTFWDFEFGGVLFEQVDFFDLDYAYVKAGSDEIPKGADDDHGHEGASDYLAHDHGHDFGTVGVAVVKRNGVWHVLQGQSAFEMEDLTRKYFNQSLSLKMESKEEYALGEAAAVGNMIIAVNNASLNPENQTYILDVSLMNSGFDPLDTDHFIGKFAVVDGSLSNYSAQPSSEPGALNGLVRAGSFSRGFVEIHVAEGFQTKNVYFLMNTIDPDKKPIKFSLDTLVEPEIPDLYKQMQRKPAASLEEVAEADGVSMTVKKIEAGMDADMSGWVRMKAEIEISNDSDSRLYLSQLDLTVRSEGGYARSVQDQLTIESLEAGQTYVATIELVVPADSKGRELTLSIRDTRPNNSVTVDLGM